jgi:DNA-binding transcriptional ArsR family regulator
MVEQRSVVLDAAYGALADSTRRAILELLRGGEQRVTDVAAHFPVSLNAVSKHVRMLEKAGLVRREIRGRNHFLSAEPAALLPARDWIDHYRDFWESRADALTAHLADRAKS